MRITCFLTIAAAFVAPAALAEDIIVTVNNVEQETGTLYVALCTEDEYIQNGPGGCSLGQRAAATNGAQIVFSGVEPGVYAVSGWHDVDDNGEMKTNFMGIPREPLMASNDARGQFGPPSFEDMAVTKSEEDLSVAVNLYSL